MSAMILVILTIHIAFWMAMIPELSIRTVVVMVYAHVHIRSSHTLSVPVHRCVQGIQNTLRLRHSLRDPGGAVLL